jgi:arylsulfatase A-like enzyme
MGSASMKCSMRPGAPLAIAVDFVLLYLLYALLIRVFNCMSLVRAIEYSYAWSKPPITFPLLFGEELLIATAVGGLLYRVEVRARERLPARHSSWLRTALWVAIAAYLVFLAFDHAAYDLFFSHLDFDLLREAEWADVRSLASSAAAAADLTFLACLFAALWIARHLMLARSTTFAERAARWLARGGLSKRAIAVSILVYSGASIAFARWQDQLGFERSFLVEAAATLLPESGASAIALPDGEWWPEQPIFGAAQPAEDFSPIVAALRGPGERLNVVHFVLESAPLRETSLAPDAAYDTTPFLRRLAAESLLFTNVYSNYPGSTRGGFAMLTGRFPHMDGGSNIGRYANIRVKTISDRLHEAGYATGLFSSGDTWFNGFDKFMRRHSFDAYLDLNGFTLDERTEYAGTSWGLWEEPVVDRAIAWIEERREDGAPFYLYYISTFPHHPYRIPEHRKDLVAKDWGAGEKGEYRAALAYADSAVARLYAGLEAAGVLENTLFIVTPDHGEAFNDLHVGNRLHIGHIYEENVHIFALFRHPRLVREARRSRRVGSQIDVTPTILDLLGMDADLSMHGRSLISPNHRERPVLMFSARYRNRGLRDGHYKFVWGRVGEQLFDLWRDPEEQENIADRHGEKVVAYKRHVSAWHASVLRYFEKMADQSALPGGVLGAAREEARRNRFFGERENPLADVAVCLEKEAASCSPSWWTSVFDGTEGLAVNVFWKQPGSFTSNLRLYGPEGRLLDGGPRFHEDVERSTVRRIAFDPPYPEGKYAVKIYSANFEASATFEIRR